MGSIANLDKLSNTQNIELIESVAKQQIFYQRAKRIIKILFVVTIYTLFILGFSLFFQGYVMKELNLFSIETWKDIHPWLKSYLLLMGLIYALFTYFSARKGLFSFDEHISLADDFFKLLQSITVSFLIAVGVLFMLKTSDTYSRVVITGYAIYMFAVTYGARVAGTLIVRTLQKNNRLITNVLIIGAGKIGSDLGNYLSGKRNSGYRVVGYLDDHKKSKDVLGNLDRLESILQEQDIHEVYITIPSERRTIQSLLGKLKKYNISIKIIPEMFDIAATALQFRSSDLYPYVEVVKTPLRGINLLIKRTFDILMSSIGLIILLPVFAMIAVLIKLDSPGPIFFKQKRIGKNGIPFTLYKFRSMVVNAEELKRDLMQQNEMDGPVFKMKEDPRITKLGRFIRKYSIDELPQLINVLAGQMSLIGPRPPLPDEVKHYNDYEWRRLDVRPGLSGLWQISGRNDVSFEEWVGLDIYYIENWSITLDTKILFRTIPVVLFGKGAY